MNEASDAAKKELQQALLLRAEKMWCHNSSPVLPALCLLVEDTGGHSSEHVG